MFATRLDSDMGVSEARFKLGEFVVFNTVQSDLTKFNGETFVIGRLLTEDEADLFETGPMYEMRHAVTGAVVQAFEDELAKVANNTLDGGKQ